MKEMTVLIPTYNRVEELRENIKEINKVKALDKYDFIVLDGSNIENSVINRSSCEMFGIKYLRYDSSSISVNMRIYKGLIRVRTKYVIILADDDRLIYPGVEECIKYLNHDSNYGMAIGKTKYFAIEGNKKYIRMRCSHYLKGNSDIDNIFFRVGNLLNGCIGIPQYAVHRTENLLKAYSVINKMSFANKNDANTILFLERIFIILINYISKVKQLSSLYLLRQDAESSGHVWNSNKDTIMMIFGELEFSKRYVEARELIYDFIKKEKLLSEVEILEKEKIFKLIDSNFSNIYKQALHNQSTNHMLSLIARGEIEQMHNDIGIFKWKEMIKSFLRNYPSIFRTVKRYKKIFIDK